MTVPNRVAARRPTIGPATAPPQTSPAPPSANRQAGDFTRESSASPNPSPGAPNERPVASTSGAATPLAGDASTELPGASTTPQSVRTSSGRRAVILGHDIPERITVVAVVRVGSKLQARGYLVEGDRVVGWYPIQDPERASFALAHASHELEYQADRVHQGRGKYTAEGT